MYLDRHSNVLAMTSHMCISVVILPTSAPRIHVKIRVKHYNVSDYYLIRDLRMVTEVHDTFPDTGSHFVTSTCRYSGVTNPERTINITLITIDATWPTLSTYNATQYSAPRYNAILNLSVLPCYRGVTVRC